MRYRRNRRSRRGSRGSINTGVVLGLGLNVIGMAIGYVANGRMDKNMHVAIGAAGSMLPLRVPYLKSISRGFLLTNQYVTDIGASIQGQVSNIWK